MLSGNMDSGASEYQVEAAISKVYGSVSCMLFYFLNVWYVCATHNNISFNSL